MQGECPKCSSENLDYDVAEICEAGVSYPVKCLDCKFEGYERYNMEFAGFWDGYGNEIESEVQE